MAAVLRGRSLKSRRIKGRDNGEDGVTLDYSRAPSDNLHEVLTHIVRKTSISKARKLGYFNAFVRLIYRHGGNLDTDLSQEEIFCCLRLGLFHEAKEMRAASLRALRYFCQDEESVSCMLRLHVDYLIARSLDICIDNEVERIHALRLIRKIMAVCPKKFPSSLLAVVTSIASDGAQERDRMQRTCLATLCELTMLCPQVISCSGTLGCMMRNILECHHLPRINESILSTILNLLNHPRTRCFIKTNVDLEQLLAAFTDCHDKKGCSVTPVSGDNMSDENRFAASKMAIATAMKSWPGIIRLCKPDGSGLQSLIGVLYLPNNETRREIMDIFFDVFRLVIPEWTDNFSKALLSVDLSEMRDSWRLNEGFVADEGKVLLPHLSKTRPNLVDNHMALLLLTFISAGLLEALVEVISTSDDHVAVRATILLGELLQMANAILPLECCHHSHCLPTLMAQATSVDIAPKQRNRAKNAVNCLNRLHAMKKRGPVPCSLFLDQIVQNAAQQKQENLHIPLKLNKESLMQCFETKDTDHDAVNQAMKNSHVLQTKENFDWDWHLIAAILKWPDKNLMRVEDQSSQRFVRRLLYFFKPTNRLFSTVDLSHEDHRKFVLAGLHLVDFLLDSEEEEVQKYADEWLSDIATNLSQVRGPQPSQQAIFVPSSLINTCSQYYFLFIGRMSSSAKGDKLLESAGIYAYLLDLMTLTSQDIYVKLIVSSLDYTRGTMPRIILSKGLTATSESARLYTASLMRVLLRVRMPLLGTWGMETLVNQLYDQSMAVAMEALSVISEACEDETNLQALVAMRPSVLHLGYKGAMLLARFMSVPEGLHFLEDSNYVQTELEKWHKCFNIRYVHIVEERLNEALTTYEKTYDGSYVRRSHRRQARKDVFLPIHLYGQLVQHKLGFHRLESEEYLIEYFNIIKYQELKKKKVPTATLR